MLSVPDTRDPVDHRTLSSVTHRATTRVRRALRAEVDDRDKDLRPIGPERLRALRESIRNGTYPTDENVERALLRMFLGPARPRSGPEEGA
jgi:hypothetical protein